MPCALRCICVRPSGASRVAWGVPYSRSRAAPRGRSSIVRRSGPEAIALSCDLPQLMRLHPLLHLSCKKNSIDYTFSSAVRSQDTLMFLLIRLFLPARSVKT